MTNTRGDVEQIYNASGTLVATYSYDAWGNILAVKDGNGAVLSGSANHIGNINPIRYRGYYYDVETKLYYPNSRYYDPEVGRFISADGEMSGLGETVQGYNLFAYCMNNPVNMSDESGCWPKWVNNFVGWVNDNIVNPIKDFLDPSTNNIAGKFNDDIFFGSGSLTAGCGGLSWRIDDKIKSSGSKDGWLGAFVKVAVANATGKIGVGDDECSLALKGNIDVLGAGAQAGAHYSDGIGIGAKAKAYVLTGRITGEFSLWGWEIELGASGDLLSAGVEATIGIFTDNGGKTQFDARCGISTGLYGYGYVLRISAPI